MNSMGLRYLLENENTKVVSVDDESMDEVGENALQMRHKSRRYERNISKRSDEA